MKIKNPALLLSQLKDQINWIENHSNYGAVGYTEDQIAQIMMADADRLVRLAKDYRKALTR